LELGALLPLQLLLLGGLGAVRTVAENKDAIRVGTTVKQALLT
jgi:hypothetical protein